MSSTLLPSTLVTANHQARLACVYVRQSSPGQVARPGESTELQYHLVARAVALGWPRDQIVVIDEDLGHSGASADGRPGFQRLIAEIRLAKVGLVLSGDASRLARNNSDWSRLLELCGLFGTLLADGERLYDPASYHARLVLGRSGMMRETELHQLKQRLQAEIVSCQGVEKGHRGTHLDWAWSDGLRGPCYRSGVPHAGNTRPPMRSNRSIHRNHRNRRVVVVESRAPPGALGATPPRSSSPLSACLPPQPAPAAWPSSPS